MATLSLDTAKATGTRAAHRGRLFRKYLLLILTLVTGALLASGAISLYFTYQENKAALASLQHEKALAAASRIEQYMRQIEQQLAYAALPQLGAGDVELRRIEFLKLLRQAPEVTDIAQLDAAGREQIAVSRLGMDIVGSGKDRSQEPAFRNAKRGKSWFGPVYFRKETEPYMTIAIRSAGDSGPVTLAEVNLKFIWDVVSRIKIGDKGKAYVVDSSGFLVADPDIGLVLRKTDLSPLAHVKAAAGGAKFEEAMLSTDLAGTEVLTAMAPIEPLGWNVFVEQPVAEVYERLNASIVRTGLLLLAGLVISALAALALARGMVRPIRVLDEGAQRIGAGDLDQKIEVHTGDELEGLADQFNRMTAQLRESYAGLERKVEERTRELTNSLQQQTAISEILRVISSSPTDVQPVLDAVAERAANLCNSPFARVLLVEGETLRPAAFYSQESREGLEPIRPTALKRSSINGRAVLDRETIHVADVLQLFDSEFPDARENAVAQGVRAALAVPLVREDIAYGSIFIFRRQRGLFSPDQVALLQTFARQAAIAIDNVRLFNETKEALERQTATAEVLKIISRSTFELEPVLQTLVENATRLCDAPHGFLFRSDGDVYRLAVDYNAPPAFKAWRLEHPIRLDRSTVTGRAAMERRHVQILDARADPEYRSRESLELGGVRTMLGVPLLREGEPIGVIGMWRNEVRPFTEKQIELVTTFANQAVIAIENVRLFNETREALEQQTAISEVLRVISSSPGDVQPMLGAVAERALKLCDAAESTIVLIEGERLRQAAKFGSTASLEVGEYMPLTRGSVTGRAVIDRTVMHMADLAMASESEFPIGRELQRRIGHHAVLSVPLMSKDRAIGAIALWRMEARPFTDKQLALVKTFADQAAIAIENVRLFNETKESLERQTATSEILRVISGSPTDTQPVFDSIAERAAILCGAIIGIVTRFDGESIHLVAVHGVSRDGTEALRASYPIKPGRARLSARIIQDRVPVQIADVFTDPDYGTKDVARKVGFQSILGVPMLRDNRVIGTITVGRESAGVFPEKQVDLLKTFADQAVIAIDNVRLFNETKEALEQQTAIAEILRVISSSPTDVQPVLDAIAERAARLCDAASASMYLTEGNMLRHLASKGPSPDQGSHIDALPINNDSVSGRALLQRKTIQVSDMQAEGADYPLSLEIAQRYGHRTVVVVPLFREGKPFGTILLRRQEVRPFNEREVTLLQTFGDQTAIALENVRLFNETKEALDQQRASGEVLAAISSSIADTKPVFDTILQSCQRLFAGETVGITLVREDGMLDVGANAGPGFDELKKIFPQPLTRDTASGMAVLERKVMVYPDIDVDMPVKSRDGCRSIGTQSMAFAPMLFEGRAIGTLWVGRPFKGSFSEKQLTLLKTFADQAVIAIQNARLFNETKEALDQQRASGEVLAAISSSIADTTPVFATIIDRCERLFAGMLVQINLVAEDGLVHLAGYHGPGREKIEPIFPFPIDLTSATGTAILHRSVGHYPDVDHGPDVPERARKGWQALGVKAAIVAPMLWEGRGVGSILVGRDSTGMFSEKDIALLKTFANQAVIAIQNARLFNETKEALEQQRASGEVLAAISSSIADTNPVFDKILESCERLFAGTVISVNVVGEDGLIRIAAHHGAGHDEILKQGALPIDERTATGVCIAERRVLHFADVENDRTVPTVTREHTRITGNRALIVAPMLWEGRALGSIVVGRDVAGPFSEKEIALLKTFADQAVIAIQNARLFREIEDKSRQLEVANKHKSEFLANMSHELRTPLNAIIGFSEVLLEKLFGDLNEKQDDYLKDIHSSGRHLLTLINDILDLAKVEAGRMELEASAFDLASALSNAMTLVRERAQRHGITLGQHVDPSLGEITADERKFKQILVNLLSNAVKFTPDGGRIDVTARHEDNSAIVAVRDTGIGIAVEDQAAVFEEFRQVGRSYTNKQEGTGLGLALTKKFVELHGGHIWLESAPGKGSTFTFTIPIKR